MEKITELDQLVARLKCGDEDAATEIVGRFFSSMLLQACQKLTSTMKQKVDPEDPVLSAFRTLIMRFREGKYDNYTFFDENSFSNLLLKIVLRKCNRRVQYFHAKKRDLTLEIPVDAETPADNGMLALAASPSEAMELIEVIAEIKKGFSSMQSSIFDMAWEGMEDTAIASQLDCSDSTVKRTLRTVKKRLRYQIDNKRVG